MPSQDSSMYFKTLYVDSEQSFVNLNQNILKVLEENSCHGVAVSLYIYTTYIQYLYIKQEEEKKQKKKTTKKKKKTTYVYLANQKNDF